MDAIYKKYCKCVYNFLYKLTNDIELSEELTQETFYTAIKKINTLNKKESIRTWLYQIAKNKWKDYLKKNKKANIDLDENTVENLVANYDIEEDMIAKDNIIEFYKKIHMLDIDTREIIYLKIIRNFTFKEISQILGKNEEWARTKFYRGKLKLKESLKDEK
ncbi:MAG: RNA polymerase sigma factor [Clostridia bacterium]